MKISVALQRRLPWLNLPGAALVALLQRTPVIPLATAAEEMIGSIPVGAIVRSVFAISGLGAMHSLAGATTFITSPTSSPLGATAGTAIPTEAFAITGAPSVVKSWKVAGVIPPGLQISGGGTSLTGAGTINAQALTMTGTPTTAGSYTISLSPYEIINLGGNHAGPYNFVVNVTGGPTATAPGITTPPASQSALTGATITFTVAASGSPAPTLQWQKGGANISGATSATLTLTSLTLGDAGSYTAVATNSAGSATSSAAVLTVTAPATAPSFTTQPANQTALAGANASLAAAASGSPAPTYQWQKGGVNIAGATASTLTLTGVTTGDNGSSYTVIATNSAGSATSNAAVLTVTTPATAPSFTTQPANQTALAGGNASFAATASGSPAPTYQWQKGGVNIAGATASTLTLTGVTTGDNGSSYTVIATNSAGSATSSAALLTVSTLATAPSIATQPVSQTAQVGAGVSMVVSATGTPTPSYQWSKNGVIISGATVATYSLASAVSGDAGSYTVVATNSAGSVTSNPAVLTVNALPATPAAATPTTPANPATPTTPATPAAPASPVAPSTPAAPIIATPPSQAGLPTVNYARLSAVSVRSQTGSGDATLIAGVVLKGSVAKSVVVRGVSSTLPAMGVSGALTDPFLTLYQGTSRMGSNDNWGGGPSLLQAFSSVGLAPLAGNSLDAALAPALAPGVYTAALTGAGSTTGIALLEVYDDEPANLNSSLAALSVRSYSGPGADVLIVGLLVTGNAPLQVVVRGIGPSMGASVPTRLADTELRVFDSANNQIQYNDNWGGGTALANAFAAVGLMPLPATSKDAAAIVTLTPGVYTIQVSGVGGTSGVALAEVYALP